MNLSAEEKLMYAVMNAIYSSGTPFHARIPDRLAED